MKNMDRFKDVAVLVTGASRGIGRAVALAFAEEGARVIGIGRDRASLEGLARELRERHPESGVIEQDLTESRACETLVPRVVERLGRLDVLVNNAGIAAARPIEAVTLEEWRRMMAINLEVPMILLREAVKVMRAQNAGRIINIASDAAVRGIANMAPYCASKHALLGLGRAVNLELRHTPIRVATLCPGPVTTTIMGAGNPAAIAPEEVASAVLLAADLRERAIVSEMLLQPTRLG